jgi:dihydrofolate reductase
MRKIILAVGLSLDGYIARADSPSTSSSCQLHLGIVPVLLGEGVPLFLSGFPQRDFALIENKSYSQGLISLKYKNTRGTPDRKY